MFFQIMSEAKGNQMEYQGDCLSLFMIPKSGFFCKGDGNPRIKYFVFVKSY
jgi:hypothetical protein